MISLVRQVGFYKIICFFTAVNCHGNNREQQHAKDKCDE